MEGKKRAVSIIIPTLNEEKGIAATLSEIPVSELRKMGFQCEVIIVDGCSVDGTRHMARQFGAKVILEPRKGYGRAYKTGFFKSNGDFLVGFDGDYSYPPFIVPSLLKILDEQKLDFIAGNRLEGLDREAMSLMHIIGNRVLSKMTNLLFAVGLKDSQSGMWVFRRGILRKIIPSCDGMGFSEEIKIRAFSFFRSMEVPIKYRKRKGTKKIKTMLDGVRNLLHLLSLSFRMKRRERGWQRTG